MRELLNEPNALEILAQSREFHIVAPVGEGPFGTHSQATDLRRIWLGLSVGKVLP